MDGLSLLGMGATLTAVCSFWGWLAVTVVKTQAKVAELEQKINSQSEECGHRLASINNLFGKVNAVATDVAFIRGKLEKV